MFSRILVANRGEIACRVMRTARRLGVRTAAVYSDAERAALHVAMADEAWRLGPAPASESYLVIDRVVEAARASGAEAVHPGYGFLSENPDFVDACEAAGIVFVGPPADAMRKMGLKDAAKRLMDGAGVPVVPGYHGQDQDPGVLLAHAREMGFPVLIKAAAGGGGKGMRRVDDEAGFAAALDGARREAASSFGDDRVLVERCLLRPRHVEIQIFADAHGNAVHLFERDCSLQRRHQKVIEEAPAPGMPASMRHAMGEAAVAAARAIGYRGAGTVEFIADVSHGLDPERFYFMEMNTRLQVEHPVTEMITGQDLVEWQLLVASGGALPLSQDELSLEGHAIEARVYAEDAERGFLPATGRLRHLSLPASRPGVRVDTGVREGDEITSHYDPMIAKLIVHGGSREAALNLMCSALEDFEVAGCVTNVAFLARLVGHAGFRAGEFDTGLIERDLDGLLDSPAVPRHVLVAAALHVAGALDEPADLDPWSTLIGWRLWSGARQFVHLEAAGEPLEVPVTFLDDGGCQLELPEGDTVARMIRRDGSRVVIDAGDRIFSVSVVGMPDGVHVVSSGRAHFIGLPDRALADSDLDGGLAQVVAPLPGRIASVEVRAGDALDKGAAVVVMEAMKMELAVRAPRDGVVAAVMAAVGEQVEEGAVLVTFEEDAAPEP